MECISSYDDVWGWGWGQEDWEEGRRGENYIDKEIPLFLFFLILLLHTKKRNSSMTAGIEGNSCHV